ncbi:Pisatin demethylase [Lachnellula subtilissima]|uniref:Pisatin demethylase n=1 Tax=Lachnellula subtilissima TaxID=602034 RepID=A0A8H8RFX6_9HELO|nr:Pisatin demethylase [Lachnellula subtilissima]
MGLLDLIISSTLAHPLLTFPTIAATLLLSLGIYRIYLHPLSPIPGPLLPKITSLWLWYHSYIGDEASIIHALHIKYGPLLRVSPNEVDISDHEAIPAIYVTKGGFPKAACYSNFDIDGHKTIFSTTDMDYRTPRAKAVVPLFSTKSIRENEAALYGCVDRMVARMKEEKESRGVVNLLNLARSLAVDAVSTHLFRENYNGTSEKSSKLSASAFVDAFVAVGRFFYLPNSLFMWVEWASEKFFPDEHTNESMAVVDRFVEGLVKNTPAKGSLNYPGRLMELGLLERTELKAQCKDLLFAGTDSSGMNLATIFRQLVLHPDMYENLRKELLDNAGPQRQEIQSLPLLSAVVREGLRISMANPTRLPHVVPAGDWTFKGAHFPAGTIVGCSATELHFNSTVFPNPRSFQPERWFDATQEAQKSFFAFGAGSRSCIAKNLAMTELYMATERLVLSDVLKGARVVQEEIEIYEWFNSKVEGEEIELVWEKKVERS